MWMDLGFLCVAVLASLCVGPCTRDAAALRGPSARENAEKRRFQPRPADVRCRDVTEGSGPLGQTPPGCPNASRPGL